MWFWERKNIGWLTLSVGCEPAQGVCPSPRRGFYIGYTGSSLHSHQLNNVDTLKLLGHWEEDTRKKEQTCAFSESFIIFFLFFSYMTLSWVTVLHHLTVTFNSNRFFFTYLTSTRLPTAGSTSLWPNLEADLKGGKWKDVPWGAQAINYFRFIFITAPTQKMRLACECLPLQGALLNCRLSHSVGFSSVAGWDAGAALASVSAASRTCRSIYACTYNIYTFKQIVWYCMAYTSLKDNSCLLRQ